MPPLPPMLAKLTRDLPAEPGFIYEPKWDGFRCLAFRSKEVVDMRSRNQRPFARYFPELVEAFQDLRPRRLVLDGEIVMFRDSGFDFGALMSRLHPAASRAERLSRETPACFIAFDLVAIDNEDLRGAPFRQRRMRLEEELSDSPDHVVITAASPDVELARRWLDASNGAGVDGVMAKHEDLTYRPGQRAMVKVKRDHTADCVVAGFRVFDGEPLVASLLLGLFDGEGSLRHVGVSASFAAARRGELHALLAPRVVPLAGHPWEQGFGLGRSPIGRLGGAASRWTPEMEQDWLAVEPELVVEVGFDHWDGQRFRHPVRFRRFRPDRDAASCGLDQLESARHFDLGGFLAAR